MDQTFEDRITKIVPYIAIVLIASLALYLTFDYLKNNEVPDVSVCNNIIDFMGEKEHDRFHKEYMQMKNELHSIMEECHKNNVFEQEDVNNMLGMELMRGMEP